MSRGDRLSEVRERLQEACSRAGRETSAVRLIAVSKTRPASEVDRIAAHGIADFGENRVQEAESKLPAVSAAKLNWHLIGHLQKNKAKKALSLFQWIHSVDSESIAARLDRLAEEASLSPRVLVQVDLAGEDTKSGIPEERVASLVESIRSMKQLRFEGLMLLPPFNDDAEQTRPFFRRLAQLRERLHRSGLMAADSQLSMGMSHDFEVAIEEGATMVRVGTAIFGSRA